MDAADRALKEEQFLTLLNAHRGIIYRLVKIYANSADDQADLAQEMAFQLWRSYDQFLGQSQFSTWMYRVCLNTALTYSKVLQRLYLTPEVEWGATEAADEESGEDKLDLLYALIKTLSIPDRAIIFLYLEGLSGKEMAGSLGITEVNLRVKLNRIKDKLKKQFAKYGYEL